jgi:peptide/nickel transport system permease protein
MSEFATATHVALPGRLRWLTRTIHRARPWTAGRTSLRVGLLLLGTVVFACSVVPALSPYGSNEIVAAPFEHPSPAHPFGTDSVGRDLFVRVMVAGRLDLAIAVIAVVSALAIGAVLGTLAGAARHRFVDTALMRLVFGPERSLGPLPPGAPAVICGVILGDWAFYARLARGQTLTLRERDYVTAARTLGFSQSRIVLRHLVPGVVGTVAAYAVADAILVMITVASLSFVGVGVQPPTPEWGSLMYEGRAVLQDAWWVCVLPGAMLAITGLGLSLIADAVLADREER